VWGVQSHAVSVAWRRAVSRARAVYAKKCQATGEDPDPSFLADLTFHALRHEATSRFFEKGFNPMQVSAITGHKTLQMLKRYTHLKAEDLAKLLDG
jgi:integrase